MKELEAGKLYQVKAEKGWVIATYVKPVPAHSYEYSSVYLTKTIHLGPKQIRHVPDGHLWRKVRAKDEAYPSNFTVYDKGMEIRPVTAEAVEEITRLKREINQLEEDWLSKKKELREFCE